MIAYETFITVLDANLRQVFISDVATVVVNDCPAIEISPVVEGLVSDVPHSSLWWELLVHK